ncbi:hypothetical protein ATANTOWER_009760 [Ataeniobius toweri]|uniref:Uncharacterized protein n=1 Tax=Ataeniobius toweri TaxID=208326 RepID=A0ABU7BCA4_9TELE|nr:hypothetical protein [Ataeniobius toweri]
MNLYHSCKDDCGQSQAKSYSTQTKDPFLVIIHLPGAIAPCNPAHSAHMCLLIKLMPLICFPCYLNSCW